MRARQNDPRLRRAGARLPARMAAPALDVGAADQRLARCQPSDGTVPGLGCARIATRGLRPPLADGSHDPASVADVDRTAVDLARRAGPRAAGLPVRADSAAWNGARPSRVLLDGGDDGVGRVARSGDAHVGYAIQ